MSLVIICTKLSYSFEVPETSSGSTGNSQGNSIDWSKWQDAQFKMPRNDLRHDGLKPSEAIQTKEKNVFEMNNRKLDEYLDWYDDMWIKNTTGERGMAVSSREAMKRD
jgi:RNA polymerase I-specific transcription initiation factor RRN7